MISPGALGQQKHSSSRDGSQLVESSRPCPYWNQRTQELAPYTPGEQPRDRKYIKLNTNESPYPPSPRVLEALRAAATGDLRLYPDPTCLELRTVIAKRYGLPGPDWVFIGNGSDEILAFAFGALFPSRTEEGSTEILFPDITYSFYPVYADLWDISYRTPAVDDQFAIDVEDYFVNAGGVILPNPNAPTGRALSKKALLSIAASQRNQHRVFILDEAYVDFGAESCVPALTDHDNLLVVHTLSKSRSLAGLRVGYALGHPDLIEGLRRIKDSFNSYTLDRLALAGAAAAIEDSAYYEDMARRIIATREKTVQGLTELGFEIIPSSANFIFVRHPARRGPELFQALRNRGILVRHWNKGRIFDYLRITIGTDEEMAS
ncbi:MAG: histidinol-phosphate transaminase, partial [Termitinemataceae bacterium]